MYLMFGDEADREAVQGKKFFVYGAIFVPTNSLVALHKAIELLRTKNGMANTDSLKSASGSRPKGMSFESHRDIKTEVMKTAREVGNVKFCAQVTLHDLARNQKHDELVLWGANTVLANSTSSFKRTRRTATRSSTKSRSSTLTAISKKNSRSATPSLMALRYVSIACSVSGTPSMAHHTCALSRISCSVRSATA